MRVKWLRYASENLNDEVEYLANDDPQASQRMLRRAVQTASLMIDDVMFHAVFGSTSF